MARDKNPETALDSPPHGGIVYERVMAYLTWQEEIGERAGEGNGNAKWTRRTKDWQPRSVPLEIRQSTQLRVICLQDRLPIGSLHAMSTRRRCPSEQAGFVTEPGAQAARDR